MQDLLKTLQRSSPNLLTCGNRANCYIRFGLNAWRLDFDYNMEQNAEQPADDMINLLSRTPTADQPPTGHPSFQPL